MKLLDSNIVIFCLKGREPVVARFLAASPGELAIPSVVAYELEFGTLRAAGVQRARVLSRMVGAMRVVPFDRAAAHAAAKIRFDLERAGMTIGPLDLLIAGTAVSIGAGLVTNNVGEFSRITGLRLEDWTVSD